MDFCKVYSLVAFAHVDRKTALFTRLRCKQWSCEFCAEKNRSIWAAFLIEKLPEVSEIWYLVTLTAHAHMRTAALSLKNIRENIDRFMKRIRRVFGSVNYVRVYERHPTSDARHAHLIISGLSDFVVPGCSSKLQPMAIAVEERRGIKGTWAVKTWFKKVAQECHMGYMVDVSKLERETRLAVGYVTKYLTKSQQELNERGLRHVQTSRAIGSPKVESEYQWTVASYVTARDFENGQTLTDLQTGTVVDADFWNEFDEYPPEMN